MSNKLRYSIPLLCLFISFKTFAQIQAPAYKHMLDSLYKHSVELISVEEMKKEKSAYILDVRETKEFNTSHIKNARHVGFIWFDMRKVSDIPKDATIIVYCAVGNRAEHIGEKLLSNGYKNVFNLYGGIFEWVNEGDPVYLSDGVQTAEIHCYQHKWKKWLTNGAKVE